MRVGLILINNGIGGTEKRFANLFNYLSRNSHHTYTLVLPSGLFRLLCEQGILRENQPRIVKLFDRMPNALFNVLPFRIFGFKLRGLGRLFFPLWKQELLSRLDHYRAFDVIHYGSPSALQVPLSSDKATVIEAKDSDFGALNKKFVREGLNGYALFNCASDRICARYREAIPGEDAEQRLYVSPCSFIDYSKTFVAQKERVITFAGRVEQVKNPEMFVEAVYRVAQARRDFKAYMLGTGTQDARICRLIKERGLQQILVHQFTTHPEQVLAHSLIFVSIQQYDNYHSQALMEAMASGCVIVASDVGETWRLVSESEGFRVPLQVDAIADRLLYLLDHFNLAVEMGRAAREKVMREQNISIYADYLETLYEKALKFSLTKAESLEH